MGCGCGWTGHHQQHSSTHLSTHDSLTKPWYRVFHFQITSSMTAFISHTYLFSRFTRVYRSLYWGICTLWLMPSSRAILVTVTESAARDFRKLQHKRSRLSGRCHGLWHRHPWIRQIWKVIEKGLQSIGQFIDFERWPTAQNSRTRSIAQLDPLQIYINTIINVVSSVPDFANNKRIIHARHMCFSPRPSSTETKHVARNSFTSSFLSSLGLQSSRKAWYVHRQRPNPGVE